MFSVEMHTQVYREQYADVVRAAQRDRLVRSATAQAGESDVKRGVASWLSSRVQRQPRVSAPELCCAAACC